MLRSKLSLCLLPAGVAALLGDPIMTTLQYPRRVGVALVALLGLASPVVAQERDALAERLGLTHKAGSLPLWLPPDRQACEELSACANEAGKSVLIVGHPERGFGTAFVISRENRLVATNAHVADIRAEGGENGKLFAIVNRAQTTFEVDQVWYHPGVRREVAGQLSVRSGDPRTGPVDPFSPDVAVLHFADNGVALPEEMKLASWAEVQATFAKTIGMMGFPGYDTKAWPRVGQRPFATYHQGVVSRLTDFRLNADVPAPYLQFIQHTASSWNGFSGSPIFLPNGKVIAIHNSSSQVSRRGQLVAIPHGIRIDCLWELLVHHGLAKQVPSEFDASKLDLERYHKPDPMDETYLKAEALVDQGYQLMVKSIDRIPDGIKKCDEAIALLPRLPSAYNIRAIGYLEYVSHNEGRLSQREKVSDVEKAIADYRKAVELVPTRVEYYISVVNAITFLATLTHDKKQAGTAVELVNMVLEKAHDASDIAYVYQVRGTAHNVLEKYKEAISDYNLASKQK
jgi:tetratricopeptide (TPR) repeat protein